VARGRRDDRGRHWEGERPCERHRVDLRIVDSEEFGAALQYFTGSRAHNVAVRNRAIDRDLKLNEYGLFDISGVDDPDAGQRVGERVAGATEDGVYEALDMDPVPPELREDNGEVEAAAARISRISSRLKTCAATSTPTPTGRTAASRSRR